MSSPGPSTRISLGDPINRSVERCHVRSSATAAVSLHFPGTAGVPGRVRVLVLVLVLEQVLGRERAQVLVPALVPARAQVLVLEQVLGRGQVLVPEQVPEREQGRLPVLGPVLRRASTTPALRVPVLELPRRQRGLRPAPEQRWRSS